MSLSDKLVKYKNLTEKVNKTRATSPNRKKLSEQQYRLSNEIEELILDKLNSPVTQDVDFKTLRNRWSGPRMAAVICSGGKFFSVTFNFSSWDEDGHLGDFNPLRDITEVRPVERVVTVYEEIKDG